MLTRMQLCVCACACACACVRAWEHAWYSTLYLCRTVMFVLDLKWRHIRQDAAADGISWNSKKNSPASANSGNAMTLAKSYHLCSMKSLTSYKYVHINQVLLVTLQITHAACFVVAYALNISCIS